MAVTGPGWVIGIDCSTVPPASRASTTVPSAGGCGPPWASTATPPCGAISSVTPDGRRSRTVATPAPVWTVTNVAGEPSGTPKPAIARRERASVGCLSSIWSKLWPTAASLETSARRDGAALQTGGRPGSHGGGVPLIPAAGGAGAGSGPPVLVPISPGDADADADAEPEDTTPGVAPAEPGLT